MSGIYIPGMEMPTSCVDCVFKSVTGVDRWKCRVLGVGFMSWSVGWGGEETRHVNCPLVHVPPHGRLIDTLWVRDQIIKQWMNYSDDSHMYKRGMEDAYEVIRNAPTIIPTDTSKEET
jgi:hypothetical protein